jgi:hypothetical protein
MGAYSYALLEARNRLADHRIIQILNCLLPGLSFKLAWWPVIPN